MKKIVIGILAHVDAGKTTLAEGMLHLSGQIRKPGRVDHQDAFLDNNEMERRRGITIFSKQARFHWDGLEITLLDTPGHVDFSAEMERTLKVLDYAVLVINASDGVQGHTRTLWKLLEYYEVPVFLFVNKMDQPGTDQETLMAELKRQLDGNCVCFQGWSDFTEADMPGSVVEDAESISDAGTAESSEQDAQDWMEEIATCREALMEEYLETGRLEEESIAEAVWNRQVFPCFFGAALPEKGIQELLDGMSRYCLEPEYPEDFGARVYQITRDAAGVRLTHLKVTGGALRVKMLLDNRASAGEDGECFSEKADQLRLYNGAGYELADEVRAGGICAVTGLNSTFVGQGLGFEDENGQPVLEPVLTYRIELPEGMDAVRALAYLRQLEEEEPLLHILWQEETKEIHAQVMGEVQIEILRELIRNRFGMEVDFGEGSIVYKETIVAPVIGVGHFEPLRHYAEVELLLEPGERGSGLQFASLCSEDMLDRNWQRLVLTHLEEKTHVGVLTGSPITDMRIMLVAGRAHLKHTEGGDFRQATYRALRQGLRSAESVLLEPVFAFTLELPTEYLGRAMSDVQRMHGSFEPAVTEGMRSVLTGRAPVAAMRDYQREVNAYTHGEGHLSCMPDGYEPCHNADEVIGRAGYDPEADMANPTGSVFCAHGAGYLVEWDQVPEHAHVEIPAGVRRLLEELRNMDASGVEAGLRGAADSETGRQGDAGVLTGGVVKRDGTAPLRQDRSVEKDRYISQEEIESIFSRNHANKKKDAGHRRRFHITHRDRAYDGGQTAGGSRTGGHRGNMGKKTPTKTCLLVDGYNIIFSWEELRELSKTNIDSARDRLMDIMSNYQGMLGGELILVFDAYKVKGNPGSVLKYHNIYVVYTKEAETADQYIEKTVHEMADKYQVTVATSDGLEQMIIWGEGALRMSATGLYEAVQDAEKALREEYTERDSKIAFRPFL